MAPSVQRIMSSAMRDEIGEKSRRWVMLPYREVDFIISIRKLFIAIVTCFSFFKKYHSCSSVVKELDFHEQLIENVLWGNW
jgi:hypothetical protein